jgi:hypothetical protein
MSEVYIIAPKSDDDKVLPDSLEAHDERFFINEFDARKALEESFPPFMREQYEIYAANIYTTNVFGKEPPEIDIASIMNPPDENAEDAPQKSFEEEFGERHTNNPSMNAADYYFQQANDPTQGLDYFAIVPKEWFDKMGCMWDDENSVPQALLPPGFEELTDSQYEYNGNPGRGRLTLLSNGFIEKKMFPSP